MALGRRNKKKKIHSLLKSTVKKCHKRGRNFTRKKTPMNKHKKSRKNSKGDKKPNPLLGNNMYIKSVKNKHRTQVGGMITEELIDNIIEQYKNCRR